MASDTSILFVVLKLYYLCGELTKQHYIRIDQCDGYHKKVIINQVLSSASLVILTQVEIKHWTQPKAYLNYFI